jgi:hypothetical protein
VYLKTCQQTLVQTDARPVVQRGKLLKGGDGAYCIVSFYRCREGVVKVEAYNQARRFSHRLVLTRAAMEVGRLHSPPMKT